MAISLEMELHFQAQKGGCWPASLYLLLVDFQLIYQTEQYFSPCVSPSAAYVHCSPVSVLVELCNELDQGVNLTEKEY